MTRGLKVLEDPKLVWCTDPDLFEKVRKMFGPETEIRMMSHGLELYDPESPVYCTGRSLVDTDNKT